MLYIIQQRMRQHNRTGDRCANDVFTFLRIACVAENVHREDFILLQRKVTLVTVLRLDGRDGHLWCTADDDPDDGDNPSSASS